MKLKMYQADAFTDALFKGNPAAVLYLDQWLPDDVLQNIAMENNLAETAAIIPNGDLFDIRWFTPTHEVPFCGHATLASAHILMTEYGVDGPLHFRTKNVGTLTVRAAAGSYLLDLPSLEPQHCDDDVTAILGTPPVETFCNFENLFAVLDSAKAVHNFKPPMSDIANIGFGGFGITARGDGSNDADFVSRYFAPQNGIPEDPVTGSAHSSLVPYWARKLGKTSLIAHQVSPRGGHLTCALRDDRVELGGQAVTFMEATIRI